MSWQDALEIVVGVTRHERYRELCAESNPDAHQRDSYRALVIRLAGGELERAAGLIDEDPPGAGPGRGRCCG